MRPILQEAFESAPDGATYCAGRYQGGESNLRTQLNRILERAGIVPWLKPFVNLRSSRRTELQEEFPSHVVDAWLGHSTAVAEKHYLQVTDDHWQRAGGECSHTGSHISNGAEPITGHHANQKTPYLTGFD